jgi:trimethylamine-N-oxide reductase (cytochrome c)
MIETIKNTVTGLFDKTFLVGTLFSLDKLLNTLAALSEEFKRELSEQYLSVALRTRDNKFGRLLYFRNGICSGKDGVYGDEADVEMVFEDVNCARRVMMGQMIGKEEVFVSAAKNGSLWLNGPDDKAMWFSSLLLKIFSFDVLYLGWYGTKMPNGEMRYVNGTNGGPVFVYVRDGKIVRITPMDFDEKDAEPWSIEAHGKTFTPPKRTTATAYALAWKSLVYSEDRVMYPMKRVDWDPDGERNQQNRGISGYERISWDEAFRLVADEIVRVRRTHGPGSVFWSRGSHHLWGNIGYFTSAANRFFNCIGATGLLNNPDSWEGFAWGAVHHYGNASRRGGLEPYSTVEDCLKNSELIIFWSSDPESTSGVYGAQEGTIRREWAKELGIEVVHVDPYYNATAAFMGGRWICPRPGTDAAMALAIAWVWLDEDTYNHDFVEKRTQGLDAWAAYIRGETDGAAKTPEWQETKTGVPARVVRALARRWAAKKTYLACGGIMSFGSAARTAYGTEWARAMVCLQAMQGFGIPGVGFGGLQYGTPLDSHFWFPGYAEGGFSGDYFGSGAGVQVYNRMPQSPSLNSETQLIPRLRLPEAILEGHAEAQNMSNYSVTGQFGKVKYPAPGHSEVRMHYKYGGSFFGTQPESNRFADMYRADKLETVVSQAIWLEGETRFADVILPACTNFERWDIGEFANCGGYIDKSYLQNNHRVIFAQHKCIEPVGESKSDFDIFQGIANKLGLWQAYSEGNTLYDWARRHYSATRMKSVMSWRSFLRKGYYVVPPLPEDRRDPLAMAWFAEGRKKDTPELPPLPSEYYGRYNEGLSTPSGKFEFEAETLKRFDPNDAERMPICTWIPSWEGTESALYDKYKLQLISPHSKYSFHTMGDSKSSFINDINEHRKLIGGYDYWIFRMNPADAAQRGLAQDDIVEVYNDRASVICALELTERIPAGVVHSYESCADYKPVGEPGKSAEMRGCVNTLTPKRFITKNAHGLAVNSCLVEVRRWNDGSAGVGLGKEAV